MVGSSSSTNEEVAQPFRAHKLRQGDCDVVPRTLLCRPRGGEGENFFTLRNEGHGAGEQKNPGFSSRGIVSAAAQTECTAFAPKGRLSSWLTLDVRLSRCLFAMPAYRKARRASQVYDARSGFNYSIGSTGAWSSGRRGATGRRSPLPRCASLPGERKWRA